MKEVRFRGVVHPRPRSGHVITCDDVRIYCLGGYNPGIPGTIGFEYGSRPDRYWSADLQWFTELWSFSIANRKWKRHDVVQNMLDNRKSNAMCMNGRTLMIYAATKKPSGEICDYKILTWSVGAGDAKLKALNAGGVQPLGLYGQATFCHDYKFYVLGGNRSSIYNSDVHRLNLHTLQWERIYDGDNKYPPGNLPARFKHQVAYDGNKVYIIETEIGQTAKSLLEIPVFDIEAQTWSTAPLKIDNTLDIPKGPLNRKHHTAVQVGTPVGLQVFVCGGMWEERSFNDVWRLDIKTSQWTLMRMTVIPQLLYFHSATVTQSGCMYVFGGVEQRYESRLKSDKLYKTWLCIPKLSEIAWEAVLHYQPDLDCKSRRVLLDSGIPRKFVDRIAPIYPDDEDDDAYSSAGSSS